MAHLARNHLQVRGLAHDLRMGRALAHRLALAPRSGQLALVPRSGQLALAPRSGQLALAPRSGRLDLPVPLRKRLLALVHRRKPELVRLQHSRHKLALPHQLRTQHHDLDLSCLQATEISTYKQNSRARKQQVLP